MNEIAFFMETQNISYTAIIVTIAIVVSVICAVLTAVSMKRSAAAVMICAAMSMVFAPICARAMYWYCAPQQFGGITKMFTELNDGGYSLAGAMIGVLIAAAVTRLMNVTDDVLSLLECISPAAALGIGIGRLSGFFTNDDKGNMVFTNSALHGLPLSVAVEDEVTGVVEWRFASFMWEALAGFAIFAVLMTLIIRRMLSGRKGVRGDIFMLFLSLFGATQATLESTRYDALHMRSNGFVSMMQMIALIMLLVPPVYYTVRIFKGRKNNDGALGKVLLKWLAVVACLAGAGVAEYFVQRKGTLAMMIYPIQLLLLLAAAGVTWMLAVQCREELARRSRDMRTVQMDNARNNLSRQIQSLEKELQEQSSTNTTELFWDNIDNSEEIDEWSGK